MNSEIENRIIALAEKKEALKEEQKAVSEELEALMTKVGYGHAFQDNITGLVYKIVKPNGAFTYYKDIDYVRTKKPEERAGTLSKTEAKTLGFDVL